MTYRSETHPLLGQWRSPEPAWSDVEYKVSPKGTTFLVVAEDTYTGERAEVSEVLWDGLTLAFMEHWPSGRTARCTLRLTADDAAEISHATVEHHTLSRRPVTVAPPVLTERVPSFAVGAHRWRGR